MARIDDIQGESTEALPANTLPDDPPTVVESPTPVDMPTEPPVSEPATASLSEVAVLLMLRKLLAQDQHNMYSTESMGFSPTPVPLRREPDGVSDDGYCDQNHVNPVASVRRDSGPSDTDGTGEGDDGSATQTRDKFPSLASSRGDSDMGSRTD